MIDYTQWKRTSANVSSLLLDPENPRIPPTERELSQDELLAELIEHDRVYDLAKSIVTNGYYADELLIAAPRDGKLVVVEGNRRLAALKALLSVDAVQPQHQKKFRLLSARIPRSMIKSVQVTIAPSRDAVLPRIAEKHTRPLLEQWKPAQQARFYRSLVQGGRSEDDICDIYHLPRGKLEDFLRLDTLYQMACSLDLPPDVQRKVENPRQFRITNLERLVESQPGRDFLGIRTDERHVFAGALPVAEFKKGFAKVVTDVADVSVTSRDLNDNQSIEGYLRRIADSEPDKSKKGRFTAGQVIKKAQELQAPVPKRPKKTRTRRITTRLLPADLKCGVDSWRIHDVFNELHRLKVTEFPNAFAIMLRVLLELGMSHYIQRVGRNDDLIRRYNAKQKRPVDWYPSLRQQLNFALDELGLPLERLQLKALKAFAREKGTPMTLDSLDGFVHNKELQPTERDVRAIWVSIEPLMRIVLSEPAETGN